LAGLPVARAGGLLAAGALGPDVVYAGAGEGGGGQQLTGEVLEWLRAVNPLRDRGGEFATNCVLASIALDMALAEGEGFQAGAAELREVADIERFAGRPLAVVAGFAAVVEAVRAAGPGARGVVSFRSVADPHDHMVNVAADEAGRVLFLDGQAGRLAELPARPAMATRRRKRRARWRCARASPRPALPPSIATTCCAPSVSMRRSCATPIGMI